jgi:ethanolamine utilization protein EutN
MLKGRVIGNATSTVKHSTMRGWKLLLVQPLLSDDLSADGDPVLAVDLLGAGVGETVIISNDGKATGELMQAENTPVRWSVVGIVDQ